VLSDSLGSAAPYSVVVFRPAPPFAYPGAMEPVSLFLITVAAIFLIGILGELVFEKTGIPDVIWLILVGILLGPVSGWVQRDQLHAIAPYFGALTLVVVLFDGGSELRLSELSQSAPRGALLATLGFTAAVAVVAPASMVASFLGLFPETWTWLHGVMLGTILGGSSAVVIMPALRKAGIVPRVGNILNVDSSLTDVLCVVGTVACIRIFQTGAADAKEATATLLRSAGIGLGMGTAVGLLSIFVLRRIKRSGYAYPLILGTLLLLYVAIDELGGSAALGILAVAILVGNAPALSKVVGLAKTASLGKGVENIHDEITFIIKSFFFTFIGAMLGPPWHLVAMGFVFGFILLFARIPAAFLGAIGSGLPGPARGLLAVSIPRGMAAGVLAIMPFNSGVPGTEQVPVVVFGAVIASILIFAAGFPIFRARIAAHHPDLLATAPLPREDLDSMPDITAASQAMPMAAPVDSVPPSP
jgi:potassium/hydrogen antiporter